MIEAANALNEVTYEPQGPHEVKEPQQIPNIQEAEPLSQQDANPGKTYYYNKISKTNKNFSPLSKAYKNNDIWLYFLESLPQNGCLIILFSVKDTKIRIYSCS